MEPIDLRHFGKALGSERTQTRIATSREGELQTIDNREWWRREINARFETIHDGAAHPVSDEVECTDPIFHHMEKSGDHIMDNFAMNIGQTVIATRMLKRKSFVIETQLV